jgi:PAS domain S-box-containing protein
MEASSLSLEVKVMWAKFGFISYAAGPLAWMFMVLQITEWTNWLNKRRIVVLLIIPVITIILIWTNELHGLIWSKVYMSTEGTFHTILVQHGLWFWVHAIYSDGVNLFSTVFAIAFWKREAPFYGKQYRSLAISMIFVMLVNLLYVFGIFTVLDPTPIAWGISSVFITKALFQNKLFDLVPIARNRVFESMSEGIVVIDICNRIVDINPAALSIFNCSMDEYIGRSSEECLGKLEALNRLINTNEGSTDFEYILNNKQRNFEASIKLIKNEREIILGKLLIIRDVTQKKKTEVQLLMKQKEIAIKGERERMARDLHDNIGQVLGFVNVQSQAIIEYIKQGQVETALKCLERLTDVAQDTHNTVRKTIIAMRDDNGSVEIEMSQFIAELKQKIIHMKRNYGIDVYLNREVHNLEIRDTNILKQLLNIIMEFLNNVIKHSGANTVKISFEEDEKYLYVCIWDNGQGFNMNSINVEKANKYGLIFMKERTEEINGTFSIESEVGKGTKVNLRIPLIGGEFI